MNKPRFLSGYELVAKGQTKVEATLPEIGLKDVTPNGSWLEQKQIQSALEARKQLVQVERIEKIGSLSHAVWQDDLKLAKVTKMAGSHWQFLGHNVGKQLYLRPEEALFLMESNCLLLKHNDVTVSLQKAYSLLLDDTALFKYKVYASLSRLGYRIIRHTGPNLKTKGKDLADSVKEKTEVETIEEVSKDIKIDSSDDSLKSDSTIQETSKIKSEVNEARLENGENETRDVDMKNIEYCNGNDAKANFSIDEHGIVRILNKTKEEMEIELSNSLQVNPSKNIRKKIKINYLRDPINDYQEKLQKLQNRRIKPTDQSLTKSNLDSIPNIYRQKVVTVNVPDEKYLPRNIFLNNTSYTLNVDHVRLKDSRPSSVSSTVSDPPLNVRRIVGIGDTPPRCTDPPFQTFRQDIPQFGNNFRQNFTRLPFNSFAAWRSRFNFNYYPYMFYPRPFTNVPSFLVPPRYRFQPTPLNMPNPSTSNVNININNPNQTRTNDLLGNNRGSNRLNKAQYIMKMNHLKTLQNLVARHRQMAPYVTNLPTDSLLRVITHYNMKYNERLRLTNNFELINDRPIEVIELEDDDSKKPKKRRLNEDITTFDKNFGAIRRLAGKLKELHHKKQCVSSHRRALSNVIKKFNKCYNADIYLNSDYDVIDRRHVTLDSSSDDDSKRVKRKKLRNPFNILKRMNEKVNNDAESSKNRKVGETSDVKTEEILLNYFDKAWIPDDNDFGRPEVCTNQDTHSRIMNSKHDELLFEFHRENSGKFDNWVELKASFYEHLEASFTIESQQFDLLSKDVMMDFDSKIKPLISPEDCTDMPSVLEKLRIVKTNKDRYDETSLSIDFDVYNRNVQNFRKTNLPKPHFRIICLEESSQLPKGADISSLQCQYEDNVHLVFAIVGIGSVSYLRVNPVDLDIYLPSDLG